MSGSRRETKLKRKEKKELFPLYTLKFLDWPHTDIHPSRVVTHNYDLSSKSRVHSPGFTPCIPPHKPTIHSYYASFSLLARHPNSFFLNCPSQYQSTSSKLKPLSDYLHTPQHRPFYNTCVILHSLHMAKPSENNFINPYVHPLHHSAQFPYPWVWYFIHLPNKHLRLSIFTPLILDLSFSFHINVSLPHRRTDMSSDSCKTQYTEAANPQH